MFTIKGEHYYNDLVRSNYTKTFNSLEDIFQWLKSVSGNFNGKYGNYFPTIRENGFDRISARDESNDGYQYWIYEIANENGIVFATGRTTNGHSFCADKIKEWCIESEKRLKEIQNKPNFVQL